MDEKIRENRLRLMADRQGLRLRKSRRRDPRALDYGVYWLSRRRFDSLDAVEAYLTGEERNDG